MSYSLRASFLYDRDIIEKSVYADWETYVWSAQ